MSDELLVKYLLGEASAIEKEQVQLYINKNIDNKKHYDELALTWGKSKIVAVESTISADAAWERFKQRTEKKAVPISLLNRYKWLKIAALLLLFIGSGTFMFLNRQKSDIAKNDGSNSTKSIVNKTLEFSNQITNNEQVNKENKKINATTETLVNDSKSPDKRQIAEIKISRPKLKNNGYKKIIASYAKKAEAAAYKTKGVICNGTPCPIEICITQTIKCNGQPSTVSSCSTLEPDQEGKLHYKTHDKIGRHCTMSVDEITIKTLSTGETIVLNANSTPSTAQDFFNYITGKKKGGIVAGVFHDNCNDDQDCGLKFDNNFGDLILQ